MTLTPHEWIRSRRTALSLRQSDIEQRTAELDGRIYEGRFSQLENGRFPLTALRPNQINALCQVLGITREEWIAHAEIPKETRS
ncbi:hypothetical protein E7T09_04290 [Deinococcus sp. KSM4-11]|uniref:hypothetical protein n=1 Tax=Deinococcus sp. KSM4-11 TaxID=2568654 RepID=UPI0010A4AA58|nr:hypothetical protein [Deinococcus sp. KSM4-11]THF88433.1 hypothetical protein E7T09_04290 [Deinococcus sp. KSM4-11]